MKNQQTSILPIQLEELGYRLCIGAAVPDLYKHERLPLFVQQSKTTLKDVVFLAYKHGREHEQAGLTLADALKRELERLP